MKLSDAELIQIGLNVQEYRRRGGASVLQKRGKSWFSELGKKSAARKKALKETKSKLSLDS